MDQESFSDAEIASKLLKIKIEIKAKVQIIVNSVSYTHLTLPTKA